MVNMDDNLTVSPVLLSPDAVNHINYRIHRCIPLWCQFGEDVYDNVYGIFIRLYPSDHVF